MARDCAVATKMRRLPAAAFRFIVADDGQDLIEYALLCGLIGTAGLLVLPEIADKMSAAYASWVSGGRAAWEPCPPKAVGSCS